MQQCAKLFRLASTVWLLSLGNALTVSATELLQLSPAPNIPIQRYGERYKLCLAWNDGCVTCTREACSNIGIACQPKKITCTESKKRPKKSTLRNSGHLFQLAEARVPPATPITTTSSACLCFWLVHLPLFDLSCAHKMFRASEPMCPCCEPTHIG